MSKTNDVIAVVCADIHLCENAPVARVAEISWWDAMARPLDEIAGLSARYDCPILIAGDLFDKWNPRPPLLNFALEHMPEHIWAIPGNHDLPYHNPELLGQSAYWTMVAAGKIKNLDEPESLRGYSIWPFPFGSTVAEPAGKINGIKIALIHAFCIAGAGTFAMPNPPDKSGVGHFKLRGYDAAIFGDNHIHFSTRVGKTNVFNCGCLLRRSAAEKSYKPACGLLMRDGTVKTHRLDISNDRWIDNVDKIAAAESALGMDLTGFAVELRDLVSGGLDFREALQRRCESDGLNKEIAKIILTAAGL